MWAYRHVLPARQVLLIHLWLLLPACAAARWVAFKLRSLTATEETPHLASIDLHGTSCDCTLSKCGAGASCGGPTWVKACTQTIKCWLTAGGQHLAAPGCNAPQAVAVELSPVAPDLIS